MNVKNIVGTAIIMLISVGVALAACEVVVRVMGLAPEVVYIEKWRMRIAENPRIGYEPIPNLDSTEKSATYYSYKGHSNDMGFRDYNHDLKKPKGSQRVVVIGDSVTEGLWINDDSKTYSAIMEKTLKEKNRKVDVMNFGVSGYNTQQEVETLKDKALAFEPDLVILGYCLNDRQRDDGGIYGALLAEERRINNEKKALNKATTSPFLEKSALIRFINYTFIKLGTESQETGTSTQQAKANTKVNYDKFAVDTVTEYFGKLNTLATENDFEVLVLIFPDFGQKDENLHNRKNYPFEEEHRTISNLAKENSFTYLDLYEPFQKCKALLGHNVSYDRYHPNPEGSVCIGRAIAEHVDNTWLTKQ